MAPDLDEETFGQITFREGASPFEHRMPFFFATLACGYDLAFLLEIFGNLEPGAFSLDGRVFQKASAGVPAASVTRFVIVADGFRDGIVIYVHQRRISHIVATRSMAGRRAFIAATVQPAQGFLPPFLLLASDDTTGQLIVPTGRVTDLYDARRTGTRCWEGPWMPRLRPLFTGAWLCHSRAG